MSGSIYLVGSEDVRSAGGAMLQAASEMQRAATSINDALEMHRRFMEEWIGKFENAVKEHQTKGET